MLLRARRHPGSAPGEDERARIVDGFASLLERLRAGEEESAWGDRARRLRSKRMIRADRENRINDYRDEGIDPVFADRGQRIVVSLSMLEHMGYRVEEFRGETVLVRPTDEGVGWER
jgi:hypothetical protein